MMFDLQILISAIENSFNCTLIEFTCIMLIFAYIIVPFCKWAYRKCVKGVTR